MRQNTVNIVPTVGTRKALFGLNILWNHVYFLKLVPGLEAKIKF